MNRDRSIVLASASPRRFHLLTEAGWRVKQKPSEINETLGADEPPAEAVRRLAMEKASKNACLYPHTPVVGADTMVLCKGRILGKPKSLDDAKDMLFFLAGRTHTVITGVALLYPEENEEQRRSICWITESNVSFKPLTGSEINDYLSRINPLDKAGGYAIQEHGELVIARIEGLRSNVMGLPVEEIDALFQ